MINQDQDNLIVEQLFDINSWAISLNIRQIDASIYLQTNLINQFFNLEKLYFLIIKQKGQQSFYFAHYNRLVAQLLQQIIDNQRFQELNSVLLKFRIIQDNKQIKDSQQRSALAPDQKTSPGAHQGRVDQGPAPSEASHPTSLDPRIVGPGPAESTQRLLHTRQYEPTHQKPEVMFNSQFQIVQQSASLGNDEQIYNLTQKYFLKSSLFIQFINNIEQISENFIGRIILEKAQESIDLYQQLLTSDIGGQHFDFTVHEFIAQSNIILAKQHMSRGHLVKCKKALSLTENNLVSISQSKMNPALALAYYEFADILEELQFIYYRNILTCLQLSEKQLPASSKETAIKQIILGNEKILELFDSYRAIGIESFLIRNLENFVYQWTQKQQQQQLKRSLTLRGSSEDAALQTKTSQENLRILSQNLNKGTSIQLTQNQSSVSNLEYGLELEEDYIVDEEPEAGQPRQSEEKTAETSKPNALTTELLSCATYIQRFQPSSPRLNDLILVTESALQELQREFNAKELPIDFFSIERSIKQAYMRKSFAICKAIWNRSKNDLYSKIQQDYVQMNDHNQPIQQSFLAALQKKLRLPL